MIFGLTHEKDIKKELLAWAGGNDYRKRAALRRADVWRLWAAAAQGQRIENDLWWTLNWEVGYTGLSFPRWNAREHLANTLRWIRSPWAGLGDS